SLSLYSYIPHRDLHSFPTRRSSDLKVCRALLPCHIANKRACPKFQVSSLGLARRETRNQKRETGSSKQLEMNGQILFGIFPDGLDRKSTRLNSSHVSISYAVFCLKK